MNTDQAFELLRDAGVAEDESIKIVRRWLLERKIKFEAIRKTISAGYILENTDEAFDLLKDAGVLPDIGIHTVKRWLREGKIHRVGKGDQLTQYLTDETTPNKTSQQEKMIRQLKVKVRGQNEQIKGMEELHQSSIQTIIQQREKLTKEMINLKKEKDRLQNEAQKLLKENLHLRKKLFELREEINKGKNKQESPKPQKRSSSVHDYREKLALPKTASDQEVLSKFKSLLKKMHPDHGGSASAFHYIKKDYDRFRDHLKNRKASR